VKELTLAWSGSTGAHYMMKAEAEEGHGLKTRQSCPFNGPTEQAIGEQHQ